MQKETIYILGIPTHESLVENELSQFFDDNIPTILLFNSSMMDPNSEWNFISSKEIQCVNLSHAQEVLAQSNIVACSFGKNIYVSDSGENQTHDQISQKFLNRISEIKDLYPNARIAYCTLNSPFNYTGNWLNKALNSETPYTFSVIDCKSFVDEQQENFIRFVGVINPKSYSTFNSKIRSSTLHDRSGIFFNSDDITLPNGVHTDKTFDQIVDETALSYIGRKPVVAWSGGIDSTTVLAAFVKNNVDFKVTVNDRVIIENKEVYDFIKDRYEIVPIPNSLDLSELAIDGIIVTGEGCDQLYPKIHHDFLPNFLSLTEILITKDVREYHDALMNPVDPVHLYNNVKESFVNKYSKRFKVSAEKAENFYNSYVQSILNKLPIEITHFYQLHFMFRLIFNYQHNIEDGSFDKYYRPVCSFYDTPDFQKWAITNLDHNFTEYGKNYLTYKYPNKNYNYSVFQIESLLNQIKMHSTTRNFVTKELILPKSINYYST